MLDISTVPEEAPTEFYCVSFDLTPRRPEMTDVARLPANPSLETIQAFERVLRAMPNQLDLETNHHFAESAYLRELVIPAGVVLTGKLHKTQHFLVVTQGLVECKTDQGMTMLRAGSIVLTQPGTKRVLLAHEDSRMVTFHVTDETDPEVIESQIIDPELPAIEQGEAA